MSRPAAFLDRDGVLVAARVVNGVPRPPANLAEMRILPGVREACAALAEAGMALVCVTNQPDIARGTQDRAPVAEINDHLERELGLDAVKVCPHDDADDCACRKPKPGMILEAASELDLDLARSVTVGDRWRDVEAGRAAATLTIFIERGYAERRPVGADLVAGELEECVPWIIERAGLRS